MFFSRCHVGGKPRVYELSPAVDMYGKPVGGIPVFPKERSWVFRRDGKGGCAIYRDADMAASRAMRWSKKLEGNK